MLIERVREKIEKAGFSISTTIVSDGEHSTKYGGGYHAICTGRPPCNSDHMGALSTGATGFISLEALLTFIEETFPQHREQKHPTRFVLPSCDFE
jgi:hypothetical protein